jgi:hypothetical protein
VQGDQPVQPAPLDRLEVRILALCDHAAAYPDGKMFLSGVGVGQTWLPQLPGALGPLFLVVRLSVPWHMLGEPHTLLVQAMDLDRNPIGPNPLYETRFELGRPPGHRPGDESNAQFIISLTGYPVQQEGTIRFHLQFDGESISSVPLKVQRLPPPTAAILG